MLERCDARNHAAMDRAQIRSDEQLEPCRTITSPAGEVTVEVMPAGIPANLGHLDELTLVLAPLFGLHHLLFHGNEHSAVVHRPRRGWPWSRSSSGSRV